MRRLRWKLIWLFFISAALAALTSVGLAYLASVLYYSGRLPFARMFLLLQDMFGIWPIVWVVGVILFIVYVLILSMRQIRYIERIGHSVQQLSLGQLDYEVPVRTRDELGQLAASINRMAAQLKSSMEEERQAVQAKQELVTNVSHDLRTPLTSIKGYLQYIHENRYKDEVELMYYADIAYEKAQRLDRMVNDLFEYTRVAYGQMKLHRVHIDLMELLGQLCTELRLLVTEAGMEISLDGPRGSGAGSNTEGRVLVSADGDKLVRVFENLIANAVQYGKDGRRIDLRLREEGGMAVVQVVNYGEPIPISDLPLIFDRFQRVDKSRSDRTGGTGLGLAIARNIVELHGGTIDASSDATETCFTVRLPLPG